MEVFHYTEVKREEAKEEGASKLKVRWLITKETGAPNFAMRLFEMEPSGHSPLHSHPWEHEVFVLEGEGVIVGMKARRGLRLDTLFSSLRANGTSSKMMVASP